MFNSDTLIEWFHKNRRDLPWRRTQDPYKIWVSEIMLQQTTVVTVIPYYERFLKRFPALKVLARAPEEEVLKLWSGLGYYSRARNLHRAAQQVMKDLKGKIPQTAEDLQTLPGIGRYTAGAVASIAFGERAPILDGNVIRVLSRLFAIFQDPKSSEGQKIFWKMAKKVLPQKNCGDFNQALMELGATLCSPENPLCPLCPLESFCEAKKQGKVLDYPKGKKKITYRGVLLTAAIILKDNKVLMVQRPQKGLLKGMWEFPMVEGGLEELLREWPLQVESPLPLVRHSVLNRRLKISPLVCKIKKPGPIEAPHRWLAASHVGELPASSMNRKIAATFLKSRR